MTAGWDGDRYQQRFDSLAASGADVHGEADFVARLEKDPPAAFVFIDKSPLISWQDSWIDFQRSVPTAATWVKEHYRQTAVFDPERIWLRKDRAEGIAEASPRPLDLAEVPEAAP